MNLDLHSRSIWDMKNELRSAIPQTLWIKIRIPIGYPMHSVKPKINSDFRFHTPYEAKSELRFRLPGMFEVKNEFRFPSLYTLWSKIGTPISTSRYVWSEKWIPISTFNTVWSQKWTPILLHIYIECPKWIPILLPGVSMKQNRDSFLTSFFPLDRQS